MSELELVDGYWGMNHVTAEQKADLHAGVIGTGFHVLPIGEKMRAEAVTSNKVRIFDGCFVGYGRQCSIEEGGYKDVTIENGTAGMLRNDWIVIKYKKTEDKGIEGVTFEVLKGQTGTKAVDPVPNTQDIRKGAFESEMPLYRVKLNGLAIEAIEPLFSVPKNLAELTELYSSLNSALENSLGSFKYMDYVSTGDSGNTKLTMNVSMSNENMYLVFVRRLNGTNEVHPPYGYLLYMRSSGWNCCKIGEESDVIAKSISNGKLTLEFKQVQWVSMRVYRV